MLLPAVDRTVAIEVLDRLFSELNPDVGDTLLPVSYTHLRAHETVLDLVCRLLLEKKKTHTTTSHCAVALPAPTLH